MATRRKWTRFTLVVIGSLCLLIVPCIPFLNEERKVESIVGSICKCPSWTTMEYGDDSSRAKLTSYLEHLRDKSRSYGIFVIRKAMQRCERRFSSDVEVMGSLYLLNRYLCNVPSKSVDMAVFGGWGAPDQLWPLETTEDGHLILTGTFRGYNGGHYRATDEFDYLLMAYGLRD